MALYIMKNNIITILVILMAVSAYGQQNDSMANSILIKDSTGAIESALQYTGFNDALKLDFTEDTFVVSAELVTYSDSTIPFLYDKIVNQPVWIVRFEGIVLNPNIPNQEYKLEKKKDFDVYIDAENGLFLKADSPSNYSIEKGIIYDSVQQVERDMSGHGERYVDFVTDTVKISMYQALSSSPEYLWAKGLQILLVQVSYIESKAEPEWIVYLDDPPTLPTDYDIRFGGEYSRFARIMIDAMSGKSIDMFRRFKKK